MNAFIFLSNSYRLEIIFLLDGGKVNFATQRKSNWKVETICHLLT